MAWESTFYAAYPDFKATGIFLSVHLLESKNLIKSFPFGDISSLGRHSMWAKFAFFMSDP